MADPFFTAPTGWGFVNQKFNRTLFLFAAEFLESNGAPYEIVKAAVGPLLDVGRMFYIFFFSVI